MKMIKLNQSSKSFSNNENDDAQIEPLKSFSTIEKDDDQTETTESTQEKLKLNIWVIVLIIVGLFF